MNRFKAVLARLWYKLRHLAVRAVRRALRRPTEAELINLLWVLGMLMWGLMLVIAATGVTKERNFL
jgi:hypothetical protein